MDQETADVLFGAAILVPFLIAVFAAGLLLNRFKNRRFHAAWQPLIPVIEGKVVEDGGSAASSWLTGTFQGRHIQAGMMPNRNTSPHSSRKYNYFDIALDKVEGESDWRIEYRLAVFGMGAEGWQIVSDDTALTGRLRVAGVLDIVEAMRAGARAAPLVAPPVVDYRRPAATLSYRENAGAEWTPSPDRFRNQLALLLRLADLNAQVNPKRTQGHGPSSLRSVVEAVLEGLASESR